MVAEAVGTVEPNFQGAVRNRHSTRSLPDLSSAAVQAVLERQNPCAERPLALVSGMGVETA